MCFVFFVVMEPFEPTFSCFLIRGSWKNRKHRMRKEGARRNIGWERGQQRIAKGGLGGVLKREAFGKG